MQHHLIIGIKKTDDRATMPSYATDGSGCFDLFPLEPVTVMRGSPVVLDLGIAFEIPPGFVMLVFSRSGHGFNYDIRLANGTGIIDNDYRDSVKVKLTADGIATHSFPAHKAVAQAIVIPYPRCTFEWKEQLNETVRGLGGFGSTDAMRGAA